MLYPNARCLVQDDDAPAGLNDDGTERDCDVRGDSRDCGHTQQLTITGSYQDNPLPLSLSQSCTYSLLISYLLTYLLTHLFDK